MVSSVASTDPVSVGTQSVIRWHKYVTEHGDVLSLERFGASAPYKVIAEKFGLTVENVVERAMRLGNG